MTQVKQKIESVTLALKMLKEYESQEEPRKSPIVTDMIEFTTRRYDMPYTFNWNPKP